MECVLDTIVVWLGQQNYEMLVYDNGILIRTYIKGTGLPRVYLYE